MSMNNDNNKDNKKRKSFFSLLFGNLFGNKKELSLMEEEDVQSPWRTVINTFRGNKISMTGLLIFLTIFLIVLIGPLLDPIDLSYSETSQINVGPGKDMLNIPQALNGNLQDIAIGPTYSVGVSTNGDMYIWGKTRITSTI
ncbi:MAG: peptide ABC transporter permease, partial [Tissierellia bacterium]|nr:peptide ABC transporter permease [Tissierellia bacterium]